MKQREARTERPGLFFQPVIRLGAPLPPSTRQKSADSGVFQLYGLLRGPLESRYGNESRGTMRRGPKRPEKRSHP